MANFKRNQTFQGLGTVTVVVPDAGMYFVDGKLILPSIPAGSSTNSSVVAVVNKNGSPVYTGNAGAEGFYVRVSCAASDSITVVLSSAANVDIQSNVIKTTISVGTVS